MIAVRRLRNDEGQVLRAVRLAALADAPGDSATTLSRAEAHSDDHWETAAVANASGPLQATFLAEVGMVDEVDEPVGMVGAYANRDGVVNVVGLWAAPGHRDVGVAPALLDAVSDWGRANQAHRLRIWVVERNEFAQRFYESVGFAATGEVMPYEPKPKLRQVEMTAAL